MSSAVSPSYIWDDKGEKALGRYITQRETDFIRTLVPARSGLALDIGCGTGKYLRLLQSLGYKGIGLEYLMPPLLILKNRYPETVLLRADGARLPFLDNTFDIVLGMQVQDYFADVKNFYQEINRVLKSGGLAALTMTNKISPKGLLYELYLRLSKRSRSAHFYEHKLSYFLNIATSCGLRIVYKAGYGCNILPRQSDNVFLVEFFAILEKILCLKKIPAICPYSFVLLKKP